MKLESILSPLHHFIGLIAYGTPPTLRGLWADPIMLVKPWVWPDFFFSMIWVGLGEGMDQNHRLEKANLLKGVSGIVLDIGAGHGHALSYLDKSLVGTYIALEPNIWMHAVIRERASALGYMEKPTSQEPNKLIILSQGAEDISGVAVALLSHNIKQLDTILSILTFCSIPSPSKTLPAFVKTFLKPGGRLCYFEHVLSDRPDVARWQYFWSPVWSKFFGGCRMDVPTDKLIEQLRADDGTEFWMEKQELQVDGVNDEHMFQHRSGRCTRSLTSAVEI